ncbi:MAG: hypothetical protein IJ721_08135 [Bacteroidales bacterium]|nr:hypothetical protein [Bacteroidales bacterium]
MLKRALDISVLLTILAAGPSAAAFQPVIRNFPKNTYKAGPQNWQVVQSGSGCMYFANNDGLLEFDGRNWNLFPVRNRTDVRSVNYDAASGSLYLGASNEVGRILFEDGKIQYVSLLDGEGLPTLGEIWKVHRLDGRMFIQENQAIHVLGPDGTESHRFPAKVDCSEVVGGRLLAAIHGEGLFAYGKEGFIRMEAAATEANVRAMIPFGDAVLVVTEADGCYLLQDDRLVTADALAPLHSDQDLLLNTEDGFSLIRTEKLRTHHNASLPVFIREVNLMGAAKDSTIYAARKPAGGMVLELNSRQNSLRLSFITPEYTHEGSTEYRYQLEGYDREWVSFREGSTKEYIRLPHGRYTFRVQAHNRNTDGRSEDALILLIAAPWYKHPWMMGVYVLLMVGALLGIYVLVTRLSDRRAADIARKREEEQKKARMVKDLQRQADDLAASTMNVMRKNQILQSIDAGLERLAAADGEERRALVRKLRRDIGENIEHDDDWQKFSRHFDIVYDDYLKRLAARFPALSVGDKKMCAYLKMDLSSKEIAPLLNMTVRSVEMTRYRLRKKLGLSRDVNLADFLQHF